MMIKVRYFSTYNCYIDADLFLDGPELEFEDQDAYEE